MKPTSPSTVASDGNRVRTYLDDVWADTTRVGRDHATRHREVTRGCPSDDCGATGGGA